MDTAYEDFCPNPLQDTTIKDDPKKMEANLMELQQSNSNSGNSSQMSGYLNGHDVIGNFASREEKLNINESNESETLNLHDKQEVQSKVVVNPNVINNHENSSQRLDHMRKDENQFNSSIQLTHSVEEIRNNETIDGKETAVDALDIMDEKKISNLRKNIREVIDEKHLDSNTLAAQREESERLARVAEQQKIIREYQRQTAVNRQFVRTQNKVLSLLQSGSAFAKINDLTEDSTPIDKSKEVNENSLVNANGFTESIASIENNEKETIDSSEQLNDVTVSETANEQSVSNDVVTIEDSSSEDDCILLSDDGEELEEETEDDPHNSGLHVKDVYNVPDECGRVVVNIGHPDGEEDIFVAPQIARTIKPHQIGGVRFLFDNIIESIKRFKNSSGFGCILAHSMGLGKTLQIVCFCDIFLRHTPSKTVLCVMPINTLQNWVSEFNMWTPRFSNDHGWVRPREFDIYVLNDQQKTLSARAKIVLKWAETGGVLLMGYEMFRMLALKILPSRKRRTKNSILESPNDSNKRLLESIHQALVKPGPDLVICDEGHRIKNAHAGISVALKQLRTRRRIVLTGYPLQNNLLEYWCMVDFVRPNYLGTRTEFCNMFERPIQNGQCIDSTPEDIKLMRYRSHVLHSLLVGFVQRRSHLVLQQTLPQKLEYVILTRMTPFQRQLYDTFMNDVVRSKAVPNPLKAFAVCCKIWNHPDVLYNSLKKRETDLDLEIDDNDSAIDSISKSTATGKDTIVADNKQIVQKSCGDDMLKSNSMNPSIDSSSNKLRPNGSFIDTSEDSGIMDNSNKSSEKLSYSDNYYNQTNEITSYASDCNGNIYGQEQNFPYFAYPTAPGNMGYSSKPDYVGLMVKQPEEQSKNDSKNVPSSSELVDLDTKEIKTVETDININSNVVIERKCHSNGNGLNKDETSNTSGTSVSDLSKDSRSLSSSSISERDVKMKGEDTVPYEWAMDLMRKYEPGLISNSPKMEIFFCILRESIELNDRVLLFSQSLLTLNLIEEFLQANRVPNSDQYWARNTSYFRLDGSTSSQDREKLVNEFNNNPNVKLFLISTKAGSLGINLVGANRVIVFDASWNPCHDTQAVYRIYRYGQKKPCYVYRIVMDKCLEKKIYDRQIKKQGMSDRVVDECNPDAHLSMKDVTNLCHDYDDENDKSEESNEFSQSLDSYLDIIIKKIIEQYKNSLSKEPFYHDSLLIDRKEKKLSQAEKRQAHRGYEMEKKASIKQTFTYSTNKVQYRIDRTGINKSISSTSKTITTKGGGLRSTRWIPAEVWQRQGMTAQEMTLPMDVVIPTNSSDKSNIILKAGQRVMVLKSTKGIYMQLDSGKIIAIRTSNKATDVNKTNKPEVIDITSETDSNVENNAAAKIEPSKTVDNEPKSSNLDISNAAQSDEFDNIKNGKKNESEQNHCSNNIVNDKIQSVQHSNADAANCVQTETISQQTAASSANQYGITESSIIQKTAQKQKQNEKIVCDSYYKRKKAKFSGKNDPTENLSLYPTHSGQSDSTMLNSKNYMHYVNQGKEYKKLYPETRENSNFNTSLSNNTTVESVSKNKVALMNQSDACLASVQQQPSNKTNLSTSTVGSVQSNSGYYGTSTSQNIKHSAPPTQAGEKSTSAYVQNSFINQGNNSNRLQGVIGGSRTDCQPEFLSHIKEQDQLNNMDTSKVPAAYPSYSQQQQHYQTQHKFPLYMPPYNLQPQQYNPVTPSIGAENSFPVNTFFSNRDSSNYSQYCDNLYNTNSMQASCDYSGQLTDYSSYGAYNHQAYPPPFHSNAYGGAQPPPMGSHSYMHWSPLIEPRNIMYPTTYSQNGPSSEQWHHQ